MAEKINKNHRLSKIFKRALALFIIVIINFNSYAAVVSSNDGSAFITKAEFDALVNDFNSRIEDYEKSIDAKIDGAIAEYLAGLATASSYVLEDLIHVAKANNENNLKFIKWKTPQPAKNVEDVSAALYLSNSEGCAERDIGIRGYVIMNNHAAYNGSLAHVRYTNYEGNEDEWNSYYYFASFPFGIVDLDDNQFTGNTDSWYLNDINRSRIHYDLTVMRPNFYGSHGVRFKAGMTANHPNTVEIDFSTGTTAKQPGSKKTNLISDWANMSWDPTYTITHTWTRQNDIANNDFLNYNFANTISGSTYTVANEFKDYYSSTQNKKLNIQKDKPVADYNGGDRSGVQYSIRNFTSSGSTNVLTTTHNDLTFNWKFNGTKIYTSQWANLVNNFYTTYFNVPYYKYYGIPICKPNKMTGDITFKLKFTNTQISGVYPTFTYKISDTKFPNGDLPATALFSETVPAGNGTYTKEIKIKKENVADSTNGDYLYIKIEPSAENQIVSVDTDGDILMTIEE